MRRWLSLFRLILLNSRRDSLKKEYIKTNYKYLIKSKNKARVVFHALNTTEIVVICSWKGLKKKYKRESEKTKKFWHGLYQLQATEEVETTVPPFSSSSSDRATLFLVDFDYPGVTVKRGDDEITSGQFRIKIFLCFYPTSDNPNLRPPLAPQPYLKGTIGQSIFQADADLPWQNDALLLGTVDRLIDILISDISRSCLNEASRGCCRLSVHPYLPRFSETAAVGWIFLNEDTPNNHCDSKLNRIFVNHETHR